MFKRVAIAAAAATAFYAMPASAATILTITNSSPLVCAAVDVTCNFTITGEVDTNGAFSVTSNTFLLPSAGVFQGQVGNSATATTNIDFNSVMLTNLTTAQSYMGSWINGVFSIAFSGPDNVAAGNFQLTLGGTAMSDAGPPVSNPSLGGTASFNAAPAVPEPATWAMFILGFGVLGFGMRRRNAQVTSTKATLNFA